MGSSFTSSPETKPFTLFQKQHKVGMYSHWQAGGIGAVDVGLDERLHLSVLHPYLSANVGNAALWLRQSIVHLSVQRCSE